MIILLKAVKVDTSPVKVDMLLVNELKIKYNETAYPLIKTKLIQMILILIGGYLCLCIPILKKTKSEIVILITTCLLLYLFQSIKKIQYSFNIEHLNSIINENTHILNIYKKHKFKNNNFILFIYIFIFTIFILPLCIWPIFNKLFGTSNRISFDTLLTVYYTIFIDSKNSSSLDILNALFKITSFKDDETFMMILPLITIIVIFLFMMFNIYLCNYFFKKQFNLIYIRTIMYNTILEFIKKYLKTIIYSLITMILLYVLMWIINNTVNFNNIFISSIIQYNSIVINGGYFIISSILKVLFFNIISIFFIYYSYNFIFIKNTNEKIYYMYDKKNTKINILFFTLMLTAIYCLLFLTNDNTKIEHTYLLNNIIFNLCFIYSIAASFMIYFSIKKQFLTKDIIQINYRFIS